MRHAHTIIALCAVSGLTMLAACAPYPDGYYDANGNWRANHYDQNPPIGGYNPAPAAYTNDAPPVTTTTTTTYTTYDRAGYYDGNGYYIAMDAGPRIPGGYFPPRGMCRVWFPDRAPRYQPPIEPCEGVQDRVPAGAYIVYGG